MATESQIAANRENAAASTGPRTSEGKATSARNAEKHGLFSTRAFVRPGEEAEHAELQAAFHHDLQPEGALELTLAAEIFHAAWRLRRCSEVEASFAAQSTNASLDPMADPAALPIQNAVDRARNQAHRLLLRSTAELRRLQTERQIRTDSFPPNAIPENFGLANCREIARAIKLNREVNRLDNLEAIVNRAHGLTTPTILPETIPPEAIRVEAIRQPSFIPRSAPCPCGSGAKYKRCCGRNAPAVLSRAA